MSRPRIVDVPFHINGTDAIVRAVVTLGRPQRNSAWVPGDGYPEIEILDVSSDEPASVLRPDLLEVLTQNNELRQSLEEAAVMEAVEREAFDHDEREEARNRSEW